MVLYTAVQRFGSVVSLDALCCPNFFRELTPEDWHHNVDADLRIDLFRDLDHVLARTAGAEVNVLALVEEPTAEDVFVDPRFDFCGFDLLEGLGGVSTLVNGKGFDRAFTPADLSAHGLITDLARAHANCELWALWRLRDC